MYGGEWLYWRLFLLFLRFSPGKRPLLVLLCLIESNVEAALLWQQGLASIVSQFRGGSQADLKVVKQVFPAAFDEVVTALT